MTIILPSNYHIRSSLEQSRVQCITPHEALQQDIRPIRIGILNVMPKAESYEFSLLQPLGRSALQVEPCWIQLRTHAYTTSNLEHIHEAYLTFDKAIAHCPLDGLILTGAPIEELEFSAVKYWQELSEILEFSRKNIVSTLGLCWGGLALAHLLGIPKHNFERKLFGVFSNENLGREHPILGETDDIFWCPQSRHSGIADSELERARDCGQVQLLSYSVPTGYSIFESTDRRYLMHLGHPEYEPERLLSEWRRDQEFGRKDVLAPVNLDSEHPHNIWRSHRNEFFTQWLKVIYDTLSLTNSSNVAPIPAIFLPHR